MARKCYLLSPPEKLLSSLPKKLREACRTNIGTFHRELTVALRDANPSTLNGRRK
jgi:hypothetical protein